MNGDLEPLLVLDYEATVTKSHDKLIALLDESIAELNGLYTKEELVEIPHIMPK